MSPIFKEFFTSSVTRANSCEDGRDILPNLSMTLSLSQSFLTLRTHRLSGGGGVGGRQTGITDLSLKRKIEGVQKRRPLLEILLEK